MTHPTIESIRETRREIAREHGYDVDRLFDFYQQREEEEEEARERAGVAEELRDLLRRLEEREKRAEAEGMRELAEALSGDRARLSGAVERLSRQRQAAGTAATEGAE